MRINGNCHDRCGAVRVRDDAVMLERVFRIDFRNDERHVIFHAEGAGVVDHDASGIDAGLSVEFGDIGAGAEQSNVDALERFRFHLLDSDLLASEFHFLSGGTRGCEQFNGGNREISLFQGLDHFDADGARCTGDSHIHRSSHFVRFSQNVSV